ncbi:MAG TPA: hypothetical protein DCZ84_02995 [Candidatus Vogelbacteria bacterium]|uniref:Uncharacterized protein n=1 Tax=Candidatus Vogelbacteria bacterium RIFOXYD1_FULL_51_18 TaxID=1802440 RepID=A0A1G2QKM3_9BACT|nr:MAG: hypothetical protein UY66_C0012G0030 [Parcubacteria group bacterium GW2011_GWC1_51_35]KKW24273.1 MAG: hypothetical protein UY68_C0012G0014 [Parcubacteria group bacterium GW2011_GWF2_52_12]KKW26366.1 MAG: hypothetical protein UY69_C0026G0006 [Parcubacteria group bacterium GW2011_GWF1_52_5]KKW34684.1 MAG: hypothetical protein UY80_C0010G0009 [Parcubacteria group bacterium GW2011_GWB1_53_43]KKW38399.1 MAG: hypothetical protein UY88_C0011G0006 [Parcubacteria group bacterium GW2011_GWA1_54_8
MALKSLSLKLSVLVTKHGKRFVAYTPALDIATSGKSEMDVKVKFQELVSLFFEEVAIEGTINDVLTELGWKKEQRKWIPPRVISSKSVDFRIPIFV